MSATLQHIVFYVSDLDKAIQHYTFVFGPPTVHRPGWAEFSKDGFTIALHRGKGRAARFDYVTDDLEGLHSQWVDQGLNPGEINETRGIRAFQGRGADGNAFLVREQPPAAEA